MPTFIFAVKQYLHLHLLWSHTIICFCNEAVLALFFFFFHKATSTFYLHWGHIYASFIPKLCQHSFLSWSHNNTSFVSKSCQCSILHSYRNHEATSTIHFCQMTTLHTNTEVMPILVFATKPRQHFIRTNAMPTFIFVMKPRQHSTLALAFALKLHQYLH